MTPFGTIFTLENANGVEARIMSYGGTVVSLEVLDRDGAFADVVLGFDDLDGYRGGKTYFGALIGRYANRIGKGRFALGGVEYRLAANDGENHLHGGPLGFDKVVWDAKPAGQKLVLGYLSKDGEEGYPGNLSVEGAYTLTDQNELAIELSATTDRDTIVNLSHHSYFNLAGQGQGQGDIVGHRLTIDADRFTPVDAGLIPTGELRSVEGTPFDFRRETAIGARIDGDDDQLTYGRGYDHNWVLRGEPGQLRRAARVVEPKTGRTLEVFTTEPGLQFYSGNYLDGARGKGGAVYGRRSGFCLEAQHYPDSPNQRSFPTTTLRAGGVYRTKTVYRFSVDPR
jgi:aldose 1-epimerase